MVKNLLNSLFVLSICFNLTFISTWMIRSRSDQIDAEKRSETAVDTFSIPLGFHREIGVTEEQWKKIKPLVRDFQKKTTEQRHRINCLRNQLMDLLVREETDKKAILSKQEEILTNQRRMQDLVIDHLLKEKKILSPEQAKKLMWSICEHCRYEKKKKD